MKKNIWIFNHYATNMYKDSAGRHYWFAENLIKQGYNPTIFCATTIHNSNDSISIGNKKYSSDTVNGVPFVFVKTPSYLGNGLQRIKNMVAFYNNLFSVAKDFVKIHGKPDVILASSVHPLTLVAGIKIAKRLGVPCICEVRDLWPETLIAYGSLKRESLLSRLLYLGEKWIYKKADKLIFTMEGGKDYIIEKGWDKANKGPVDISKVHHINNGIDLELYDHNKKIYCLEDNELNNNKAFNIVYTGSIRAVNKVEKILDVAKLLKNENINFLIWGSGDYQEIIKNRIENEQISNVYLKGRVDKKYIPFITTNANINLISGENISLFRYGASLNKIFDYLASGKPILSTKQYGYSIIRKNKAGIELENSNPDKIAEAIMYFKTLNKEEYERYCLNARQASNDFCFKKLTNKLIKTIES
ncbi:glycosyltransferase family 4 protein [Bacillus sp. H-16]|uniref:glycosyltransferase family 4 protein n=1 Tax=Alteribacter salitolerans TaxID=2912333 RepID=UPI0019633B31|nr:glycosyltransferase family 4 protein [Alteribacter salitolerans]MBM7095676.1 glycosyltransferase family 4 protein [Alteribacter salitolerans]